MRAVSVRQPWASLLVDGRKSIETRTWDTSYRGKLAIHAGVTPDLNGPWAYFPSDVILPRGAVLGTVELVDCRPMTPQDEHCACCGYKPGLYAWVISNPIAFADPIQMRGRLGLWDTDLP